MKDKFFCNGVNKKCSDIKKEKFLDVLLTKKNSPGVNRGLCVVNNTMYTETQVRCAFSYFHPKTQRFRRWGQYPASGYLSFVCKCL